VPAGCPHVFIDFHFLMFLKLVFWAERDMNSKPDEGAKDESPSQRPELSPPGGQVSSLGETSPGGKHAGKLRRTLKGVVDEALRERLGVSEPPAELTPEEEAFLADLKDPEVARQLLERARKRRKDDSQHQR
jgi:hypothetical protein